MVLDYSVRANIFWNKKQQDKMQKLESKQRIWGVVRNWFQSNTKRAPLKVHVNSKYYCSMGRDKKKLQQILCRAAKQTEQN